MSTEDNNNAPQAADTGVSFANDVEDQQANSGLTRKTSTELLHAKDRASLSASAKAWDLDGDGELDDAEMALRDMDKGHKGTLNKEQMYKLMSDNLKTQRELFKVKKVVIGLVVFTCILALSNLGTSFAAAFLAKDTKSTDDTLTDAKTGRTLGTQTTHENILVDLDFDKEFSRRRMMGCTFGNGGNGVGDCTWNGSTSVSIADGEDIVKFCSEGKTVTITKSFSTTGATVAHQVCPAVNIVYDDSTNSVCKGNSCTNYPRKMTTTGGTIVIAPDVAGAAGAGTEYIITGLASAQDQPCDVDNHCESSLVCASGVCSTPTATVTLANINEACTTAGTCAGGLVCDTTRSVCRKVDGSECTPGSTTECSGGFKCLEGGRGAFIGSLPSRRLSALPPGEGGATSYCLCDQTTQATALSSCPGASMCTIDCGSPDGDQSCMTQDQLNSNCVSNYSPLTTCNTATAPLGYGECYA